MQPVLINKEMTDAVLGRSKGAKNKYNISRTNDELNSLLDKKIGLWVDQPDQEDFETRAQSAPTAFSK
jgi:hypothetical protein